MIDTGSSKTFISPRLVNKQFLEYLEEDPFSVSTAHKTTNHKYSITVPLPKCFNINDKQKFYVFEFNPKYDGLIGLDLLKKLNASVNVGKQVLETKNAAIPLHIPETNENKTKLFHVTLEPRTEVKVKIPIDKNINEGYIPQTVFANKLITPAALVRAENGKACTTILNMTDEKLTLELDKPLEINEIELSSEQPNLLVTNKIQNDLLKQNLKNLRLSHMNVEEKRAIHSLCLEYRDIFHCEGIPLSFTNKIKHNIRLKNETPIFTKTYRYPHVHKQEVQQQVSSMLKQGIIRDSVSPWSSPVWIVPKKADASGKKKWRMVIDYRKLNEQTLDDKYPLPNITDILDKLGKSQYFSTLDLASGFHQIEMNAEDIEKTAFSTEHGHYEYTRMPFGLKNAPSTFQRVMDNILRGLQTDQCLVYLDDIIIYSTSLQEHINKLKTVFERLRQANFKIQLDKSEFLRKEVAYLGHVVTPDGVKPNPDKINAILKFPIPRSQKEIKSFLGLLGYYRRFIQDFAKITKPLTKCLKKGHKIEFTEDYVNAFETCKQILTNDPILQYPDFTKPFILTTDASNVALGAVLSQGNIGTDKPVAYASRTLNETEQRYSTIEKELLAIIWATKYFRPYLYGRKFIIYTDHRPLTWLFSLKEPNSKLVRWRLKLEEFDYKIEYKKGKYNTNADALSRIQKPEPLSYEEYCNYVKNSKLKNNNTLIIETSQDLFEVPKEYSLAHCVSRDFKMSAGIALQFRDKFNNVKDLISQEKQLYEIAKLKQNDRLIYYLITKENYYDKPSYESLYRTLINLSKEIEKDKITKLAIPKLGCGLDRLKWSEVKKMLNHIFTYSNVEILVCTNDIHVNAILDSQSMVVELDDTSSVISEEKVITIHSTDSSEPPNSIPIKDEIINSKLNQIYATRGPFQVKIQQLDKRQIFHVKIPSENSQENITQFFQQYLVPNISYALYTEEDELYKELCRNYCRLFTHEGPTVIRYLQKRTEVLDEEQQILTVRNYHEGKTNHRGINETLAKIKNNFYWPNMKKTIENFINNCRTCKTFKYDRKHYDIPINVTPTPCKPFEHLHIDTFSYKKSLFLTIIDSFSKLAQVYPITAKNPLEISKGLINYFSHYGTPTQITSDQGKEFANKIVKDLLASHKIEIHFTTPKNPQSNAPIERFHSTLIEHLKLLENQYPNDNLETVVKYAVIAYNSSIHSATGLTPYDLTFGHTNSRDPNDILTTQQMYENYVKGHLDKIKILYNTVKTELSKTKEKVAAKHEAEIPFNVGETIYYTTNEDRASKASKKYIGPAKIIEINPDNTCILEFKNKQFKVHTRRLKHHLVSD